MAELTRSTIKDDKFYLGQLEMANIIRPAIRSYRFNNNNQSPEAVVLPFVEEVDGIKIEFTKKPELTFDGLQDQKGQDDKPTKPGTGKASS